MVVDAPIAIAVVSEFYLLDENRDEILSQPGYIGIDNVRPPYPKL